MNAESRFRKKKEMLKRGLGKIKSTGNLVFTVLLLVVILFGLMFFYFEFETITGEYEVKLETMAYALSSGIPKEVLDRYNGDGSYADDKLYREVTENIKTYVAKNEDIVGVSLFVIREGQLIPFIQTGDINNHVSKNCIHEVIKSALDNNTKVSYVPDFSDIPEKSACIAVPVAGGGSGGFLALETSTAVLYEQIKSQHLISVSMFVLIVILYIIVGITFMRSGSLREDKKRISESVNDLKEKEMLFRSVFEQAAPGISINSVDEELDTVPDSVNVNDSFKRITGYTLEQLKKISWTEMTHSDFVDEERKMMQDFLQGNIDGYQMEKKIVRADGTESWINIAVSALYPDNQQDHKYLCILEDIGNRKKMESSLAESEKDKAILISNVPGMLFRIGCEKNWTLQFVSSGCLELTGYPADRFMGKEGIIFGQLIIPEYSEYVYKKVQQAVADRARFSIEYEISTASGERKWISNQGQIVCGTDGKPLYVEGLAIDIDESKKRELELRYINEHHPLTDLYSRSYFSFLLNKELEEGIVDKKAAIFINIRNFSLLNATYGYAAAEEIIKELAEQLRLLCTDNCRIFHISIDRFVLYVKGYEGKQELVRMCNKITAMLYGRFATRLVGASIGVYEFESHMADGEIVIRNASIAAEHTDRTKVFSFMFFNADMEKKIMRSNIIEEELAEVSSGTEKEKLYAVFQPIVRLSDDSIAGFEALARFNSDILGNVPPNEFIPIAEEKQYIFGLSRSIIRQSLEFVNELSKKGADDVFVSVNISVIQLLHEDFVADIVNLVREYSVNPDKLVLEITETKVARNYAKINEKLSLLQNEGFKIAMDDFGTGYSSLARESEMNVNYVKIDKYFMDKLLVYDENQAVTSDIISMSHKLGYYIVAEGVEYTEQKEYLKKYYCDYMQGYLFSRPISAKDALLLVKKNHARA